MIGYQLENGSIAEEGSVNMTEAEKKKIDILLGETHSIAKENNKLFVDPTIVSRLDEINKELTVLRNRRKKEEWETSRTKMKKHFEQKILDINKNYEDIQALDNALTEAMSDSSHPE